MRPIDIALAACVAGQAVAQLYLSLDHLPSNTHVHQRSVRDSAQRPLTGSHTAHSSSNAELPAFKKGQHTLIPQDGSVCKSYGEKQWTGTIDVTDERRLFFWAFESRNDPAHDPVILWMNGGPGGTSLIGLFTELGACVLRNGSAETEPNPWAWNNNATVVFLDQPAGVGFSSLAEGAAPLTVDSDGAEDFQQFLNIFFHDVFPDKAHLPLHIAAESYGGHYGPTYVHHILESRRYGAPTAFNGNLSSLILVDAVIDFGGPMMGQYELLCADQRGEGILTEKQCEDILTGMPEAERLWRECEQSRNGAICTMMFAQMGTLQVAYDELVNAGERSPFHLYRPCSNPPFCANVEMGNITAYLNQKDVLKTLDFPASFVFHDINLDLNTAYVMSGTAFTPTTPLVAGILDAYKTPKIVGDGKSIGDVRVMVLNGNLDFVVNSHGNKMQYERIVWSRMGEYRAAKWRDLAEEDNVGGGSWKATKDGRLAFLSVDGAGHMVPGDIPAASYHILQRWLHNQWRG